MPSPNASINIVIEDVCSRNQQIKVEESHYKSDIKDRICNTRITLMDLNSRNKNILSSKSVPKRASSTCQGQRLLRPTVQPSDYKPRLPSQKTIREFRFSKVDIRISS